MMILMFVTLYTSRVMLEALGVIDFGISNVVGGIIVMLSFINGSMSLAVNRFLAFEMGKNGYEKLNNVFCTAVNIHFIIAILAVIIGETIGLWFVNTQLVIPAERIGAANWVYQFSIVAFVFTILRVPYNALIIAHEEMKFYAYIGILEGILRLAIAFSLLIIAIDKLALYGGMFAFVTGVISLTYYIKCKRSYQESEYSYAQGRNRPLLKEMLSYAGISTMGNLSTVIVNQGQNILLNIFFGPVVNAARAISYQINGALSQFVSNIYTAATPQVTKSYAANDREYLVKIVNQASLLSLICLLIFLIPIILELPFALKIWLGNNIPPNTALFCRFVLIDLFLLNVCRLLLIAIQSSGKILKVHLYTGCLDLLNLPIAYCFLKFAHSDAYVVFVIKLFIDVIFIGIILYLSKIQLSWNISHFVKTVIIRSLIIALFTLPILTCIQFLLEESLLRIIIITLSSMILIGGLTYFYILDVHGRIKIRNKILTTIFKNNPKNRRF